MRRNHHHGTAEQQQQQNSPVEGISFSFVHANGITHRLSSTVKDLDNGGGARSAKAKGFPLILFLHGFPESWYSWRHQLLFLREEPFFAVAPDMRGYGKTSQPTDVEDYTLPVVARDVVEIAKVLGYDQFLVVGHDWGAMLAWAVALLYPELVLGVCGMSVPYAGTPKVGLLTMLQYQYGACLGPNLPRATKEKARFHYILHHCLPRSDEEYDKNARELLYRIYSTRRGCEVEEGTPEHDRRGLMFPQTGDAIVDRTRVLDAVAAPGLWARIPRPKTLPPWLTQKDLDYYIQEFEQSGFHGGLCYYRALDRNFELMKECLEEKGLKDKVLPPSLFLSGENDNVVQMYGGKENTIARLKVNLPNLVEEPIFVKGCDHWIQQEESALVNGYLRKFFHRVVGSDRGGGRTHFSKM